MDDDRPTEHARRNRHGARQRRGGHRHQTCGHGRQSRPGQPDQRSTHYGSFDRNGVRLRIIGDLSRFEPRLQELIRAAEAKTAGNSRLQLTIAANYGGRWDIMQAVNAMLAVQFKLLLGDGGAVSQAL